MSGVLATGPGAGGAGAGAGASGATGTAERGPDARPGTPEPTPGVQPRVVLTDEELLHLTGTAPDGFLAPFVGDQAPGSLPSWALAGEMSLRRRGLLLDQVPATAVAWSADLADGAGGADDGGWVAVPDGETWVPAVLGALIAVRQGATRIGLLQVAGDDAATYLHVTPEVVVVEQVTRDGVHTFGWVEPADVPGVLGAAVLPEGAVTGHGPVVAAELGGLVAAGHRAADLCVVAPGGDPSPLMLAVLSGSRGTFLGQARFGSGAPVVLHGVDPAEIPSALAAQLCGTVLPRPAGTMGG